MGRVRGATPILSPMSETRSPPPSAAPPRTRIDEALALTDADRAAVDALIRARLGSDVALVNQVAEHIIASGGKRLRPLAVLLAARAAGYRGGQHVKGAAIIEFIHTATLLHDDVVDASDLRRGRRTANAVFGNAASVLVGDFLYSRAFQMMVELDAPRVMPVLADTTNRIAEGEVLQLMHINNPGVTESAYFDVVERKTAALFDAAMRVGALIAGAPVALEQALATAGREIGFAFQLADDWLDYAGDARLRGKNLGDDLAEGKATLPMIRALAVAGADDRRVLERALIDGDVSLIDRVLSTIRTTGALDYAEAAARRHVAAALTALSSVPDSPERDALAALARYAVERER